MQSAERMPPSQPYDNWIKSNSSKCYLDNDIIRYTVSNLDVIIVPSSHVDVLLKEFHELKGHFIATKMFTSLCLKYFWFTMRQDVENTYDDVSHAKQYVIDQFLHQIMQNSSSLLN
jgi:hypothetical protein